MKRKKAEDEGAHWQEPAKMRKKSKAEFKPPER